MDTQLASADLAIRPDLRDQSGMAFDEAAELIARGREAALEQSEALAAWAVSEEEFRAHRRRIRAREPEARRVGAVRIEGATRVDERRVRALLRVHPGQRTDLDAIERDAARVFGIGEFERVAYRLEPEETGVDLIYMVEEKSWGPGYLRLGLVTETAFGGDSAWHLRLNYTRTQLPPRGSEWRIDAETGTGQGIETELFLPLSHSGVFFAAPRIGWRDWTQPVFEGRRRAARYDLVTGDFRLDLGVMLREYGTLRTGYRGGGIRAVPDADMPGLSEYRGGIGAWTGALVVDRLDHPFLPRRGFLLEVEGLLSRPALGAESAYETIHADLRLCGAAGRHAVYVRALGATCLGSELPRHAYFTLGGVDSMAGLARDRLAGRHAALAQLGYRYPVARLPTGLGREVHLLIRKDVGNAWADRPEARLDNLRFSLGAALVADTVIGPVTFGAGLADRGERQVFLSLGLRP